MADQKFRTEITADPAPYKAGMDQAARIAQQTAQSMAASMAGVGRDIQGSMDSVVGKVTAVFGKLQSVVIGAGAALASGGMFGAATRATVEMAKESMSLSRALGVTVEQASVLNVALGDIYVSSDTLLGANRAMTRTLRENEEGIKKLGVETRNTDGSFRNGLDVMLEVNKALGKFTEGTNRNIEGQKVYKKAWEEVAPALRLTTEVMDAARVKSERLNLTIGPESAEVIAKYRAAMNDVDDVLKGVAKTVGEVVMPVMTEMGNWFADTGPARVTVMRMAVASFLAVLLAIKGAVEVMVAGMVAPLSQIAILILTVAEMIGFALKGDFSSAKASWQRGTEQMGDVFTDLGNRVQRNMDDIGKVIANGFNVPTSTFRTPAAAGKPSTGGDDKNRMAKWEAELAAARNAYDQMKLEQGSFEQYTLAMESEFWAKKMELAKGNAALLATVTKKYYDVEREIRKQAYDAQVAELKGQMAAAETNAEQRIAIAGRVAEMEAQRWGRTSKQYQAALADMQKATDAWAKQQREIRDLQADAERSYQLSRVELERQALETLEQLGILKGSEKLKRLQDLKQIEYTIELEALQKRLELMAQDPTTDPVKYQEQLNKIRELKQKHVIDMAALDNQMAVEGKKTMDKWLDPATEAFEKFVNGVIAGTRKWTDVLRNTLLAVAQQYAAMGVKLLIEWVKTEVLKTQATVAGVTARTAAETVGSTASTASTAGSAIANIGSKAWEAAASVYASIAQIPYVGPFLAPAMAIAAAATVLGFIGKIASASGGFDIPAGVNPVTQLHGGEMVLPQPLAERVRGMTDEGGGGRAVVVNVNVTAADSRDVIRVLKKNGAVVQALRQAIRDGHR